MPLKPHVVVCILVLSASVSAAPAPLTLAVAPEQRFQVIDNFGASGAWSMDPIGREWSDENKERLADLLFSREKGIGLSLWRFNIGAGGGPSDVAWNPWRRVECFQPAADAPFDWSRQAGQQWFLRAAKQRGVEHFLACVYSPPAWMTVNGRAHCDKQTGLSNLRPGDEPRFARFLAGVLRHFADQGLPFDTLSPVNEPNWDWQGGQEGCSYDNEGIKRLVCALHSALAAAGLKTEIDVLDAGDIGSLLDDDLYRESVGARKPDVRYRGGMEGRHPGQYRQCIQALLGDPAIRPLIGSRISAHSYWTDRGYHNLHDLRALLRRNIERYAPGGRYWMSEYCIMEHKRDLGMETALRVARVIHYDLTAANASAWHWWLAVSAGDYKDGLIYTDWQANGQQNILPSKTLWVLGNFSRFVRPGAQRIALSPDTDRDGLLASAYLDAQRKTLSVVLINESANDKPVLLQVPTGPKALTPWVTSAGEDLARRPDVPAGRTFVLPAKSVVTLTGAWPGKVPAGRSAALPVPARRQLPGDALYDVRCGAGDQETDEPLGRRNGVKDQVYGEDPRTGYRWGYTSYGPSGAHSAGAGPLDSVRYDDGDTPGEGLIYRFEVPAGARLRVEVGFRDPWKNAGRAMEVVVAGKVREKALVPGDQDVVKVYDNVTAPAGVLEVTIRRPAGVTDPYQDPLVSRILVSLSG